MTIKAITFDLWDTLFVDESDEPKRKERKLAPKPVERRRVFVNFVQDHRRLPEDGIIAVFNAVEEAFNKVWRQHHITWTVAERMDLACRALGLIPEPAALARVIETLEGMELNPAPDLIPGVNECLEYLKEQHFKLGIISDAIYTPGRNLRKLLAQEDLLHLFDVLVFSDEVGRSKPDPLVCTTGCDQLGLNPD